MVLGDDTGRSSTPEVFYCIDPVWSRNSQGEFKDEVKDDTTFVKENYMKYNGAVKQSDDIDIRPGQNSSIQILQADNAMTDIIKENDFDKNQELENSCSVTELVPNNDNKDIIAQNEGLKNGSSKVI